MNSPSPSKVESPGSAMLSAYSRDEPTKGGADADATSSGDAEAADSGRRYRIISSGTNEQGNHYCVRDYGPNAGNNPAYHYSNTNGSYYYANPDGSKYYCDGKGSYSYANPDGSKYYNDGKGASMYTPLGGKQ